MSATVRDEEAHVEEGKTVHGKVSNEEAIVFAKHYYGIEAVRSSFKSYPSYDDQNIAFSDVDGNQYVFKISNLSLNGQTFEVLEQQNAALLHLEANGIPCSRVLRLLDSATSVDSSLSTSSSSSSSSSSDIVGEKPSSKYSFWLPHHADRLGRLLSFVPGKLLASCKASSALLMDLGRYLGSLDKACESLEGVSKETRDSQWEMGQCESTVAGLIEELPEEKKDAVGKILQLYRTSVKNNLQGLPKGFIHADANDYNVIVAEDDESKIAAMIDFGDFTYTLRVYDLAICVGYNIMEKESYVQAAADIVQGYLSEMKLSPEELRVVFPLAIMRMCVSICMSNHVYRLNPENAYLLVTAQPGWRLIKSVVDGEGGPEGAHARFHQELVRRGLLPAADTQERG